MRNKNRLGETITYRNTGAVKIAAGDLVMVGAVPGVAVADIQPGARGALDVSGVFFLPKGAEAVAQGTILYDQTDGTVGTAASGDPVGHAWDDADTNAPTVQVKLLYG